MVVDIFHEFQCALVSLNQTIVLWVDSNSAGLHPGLLQCMKANVFVGILFLVGFMDQICV